MATPLTTAQVVLALGARSQEEKWAAEIILNSLGMSVFAKLLAGNAGGRAIATVSQLKNIRGQRITFGVEAGLGGPGEQGAAATRATGGENLKSSLFTLFFGNHHKSVVINNVTMAQTIIGTGSADARARSKLAPWFSREREWATEAEVIRATTTKANRCVIYANPQATSIEGLRSAHTPDSALFRRMGGRLADNMAEPFAVAKHGAQEVRKYVIITPDRALDDQANDPQWQTLLAQAGARGTGNYLFSGEVPSWNGSTILPWTIQNNSANGPQGAMAMPMAFLGEALDFTATSVRTVKGGGSAAAAALTDHLYFRGFESVEFSSHEDVKIAAVTDTDRYVLIQDAATNKFGMLKYRVSNGNTITGITHLGATSDTARQQTVGNVTYDTGVWAGLHTQSFAIGSKVVPCNSYGQPWCRLYGYGQDAMMHGFGSVTGSNGAGKRTINNNDDMQKFWQPGFEEQWGVTSYLDANDIPTGLLMAYAAYNLDGMPIIE